MTFLKKKSRPILGDIENGAKKSFMVNFFSNFYNSYASSDRLQQKTTLCLKFLIFFVLGKKKHENDLFYLTQFKELNLVPGFIQKSGKTPPF